VFVRVPRATAFAPTGHDRRRFAMGLARELPCVAVAAGGMALLSGCGVLPDAARGADGAEFSSAQSSSGPDRR